MSWITELAKVYDNTIDQDDRPIPIFHTANNASITVILDGNGQFIGAEKIDKNSPDRVTVMPCTETSASRTSGADAYPLCDKWEYVFGNNYNLYKDILQAWAESRFATSKIKAVFRYISARRLLLDLEESKIIKSEAEAKKLSFIRWEVRIPGDANCCLWKDVETINSWIQFYNSDAFDQYCKDKFIKKDADKRIRTEGFDYVEGCDNKKIAMYHPAKVQGGSNAKIISSNDTRNFTYLGRFSNDTEACQISSDVTQKAHSALRWLIERQGFQVKEKIKGKIVVPFSLVTWNSAGKEMPSPIASSNEFLTTQKEIIDEDESVSNTDFDLEEIEESIGTYHTAFEFANAIKNRLMGYYGDIRHSQNIMVMAIKEASPGQGRISIVLYRELQNTDLVEALQNWYERLSWYVTYWIKGEKRPVHTIGTPSPKTIAECAYGKSVKASFVEKTILRILPCVLDGGMIPSDLEVKCVKSASNLMVVDAYQRDVVLETACAVYKYNQIVKQKEKYELSLEENRTSRDYLYGRLLAVAQQEENAALQKMDEKRETNAVRYMQQFAIKPATTWKILYEKKLPAYRRHLDAGLVAWFERKIQDITALFKAEDYISDKALSGEYLLGYQCQLKDFRKKSGNSNSNLVEDLED